MTRKLIIPAVLWLLQHHNYVPVVYANYLTTPEFQWSMPIVTSTGNNQNEILFQKGNAIVPVDANKGLLAITSATGALHIVTTSSLAVDNTTGVVANTTGLIKSYLPTMMNENLDTISCQGGIIAVLEQGNSHVVLYAITGTDSTMQNNPMSRILAINTTSATMIWNVTIPGTVVGTPVLSTGKDHLYVVHNIVPSASDAAQQQPGSTTTIGQVSIFMLDNSSNIFTNTGARGGIPTIVTTLPSNSTNPFGPASITVHPVNGKEYLFFADGSDDNTFTTSFMNSLYAIAPNDENEFTFMVATSQISSTNTAPTFLRLDDDIIELFLGQPDSTVFGWTGDAAVALWDNLFNNGSTTSSITPTWQIATSQSRDDQSTPVPNSPLVSSDGTILYITSAGDQILALNLTERQAVWSHVDLSSSILANAVYDHQQPSSTSTNTNASTSILYFMENEGGVLRQYNAVTGDLNWISDCNAVTSNNPDGNVRNNQCDSVVADFFVQNNMLYYVDIVGNLIALKVSDFVIQPSPTPEPTASPIVPPTAAPIKTPVVVPTATSIPSAMAPMSQQTSSPTTVSTISRTEVPTIAPNKDEESSTEERSIQSWFSDNIIVAAVSLSCALLFLVALLFYICGRKKRSGDKTFSSVKQTDETATVAMKPVQSNDTSFENLNTTASSASPLRSIYEEDNEDSFGKLNTTTSSSASPNRSIIDGDNDKSIENIVSPASVATLLVIKEQDNEGDHFSSGDIENKLSQSTAKVEQEKVVPNLLERLSAKSFDMEEGISQQQKTDAGILSRTSSTATERAMLDTYSLASKKEIDDAASLTGTLSIASKGSSRSRESSRSIKNSLLSVIGMAAKPGSEAGSIKSEKSQKSLQRFEATDSQIPTPRPNYLEPGIIRPGQTDVVSPLLISPTNSYDESLYMDESTIASLEMPPSVAKLPDDALAGANNVGKLPSDCPEDEVTNKLQPGLVYLNRHIEKKKEPVRASILDDTKRIQPMYNGVSVRPASRSRAGIFSRRQPKALTQEDNDDDSAAGIPEVTPEPLVIRTRRNLVHPSSPIIDTQETPTGNSEPRTPPVRFTSAGYYVEEPELDDSLLHDNSTIGDDSTEAGKQTKTPVAGNQVSKKIDTWNSFLNELSKVENQFFNPTTNDKKDKTSKRDNRKADSKARNTGLSSTTRPTEPGALPLPPPDIESDEEEMVPPPPPRTFYA